jgi:hypothetical protein
MNIPWSVTLSIFGIVQFALLVTASVYMSRLTGGPDDANELSKNVTTVIVLLCFIVAIHTLMWYVYLIYNPLSLNLYLIVTSAMCLIFSLSALGISISNRK